MSASTATAAMIVRRAPAYATVQDSGRPGFMSGGVPRSGAMDVLSLLSLNAVLGNDSRAAGIEWALTGGEIELTGNVSFAIGGASATITRNGQSIEPYCVHRAGAGDVVSIGPIGPGRFVYFAVAGGIGTSPVMNSRSTYTPGAFGGYEGRRLRSGDLLPIGGVPGMRKHHVTDELPVELRPPVERHSIRFVEREHVDGLLEHDWSVAAASDRMGYRLAGNNLPHGASVVSEPVCSGVIQIPPSGEPIVLMADAPTVGGYRIAGAVISADLGTLAQRNPGERVIFERVTVEAAQRAWTARAEILERIRDWSLA